VSSPGRKLPAQAGLPAALAFAIALALALTLVPAASAHPSTRHKARAAIVGGVEASITQAPWQVEVEIRRTEAEETPHDRCSGAILSTTQVVTAAHCVFNSETERAVEPGLVKVTAGTSNYEQPGGEKVAAASVQVHPYYEPDAELLSSTPDDVAVITLSKALAPASSIAAIAPATLAPQEGASLIETGFGEQAPPQPSSGALFSLAMTLGYSRECGGEFAAVFICASSKNGSVCFGDSGSGLTLPGPPAQLLGVTDTTSGGDEPCKPGTLGGFANIAAPEIAAFLAGGGSPPVAPFGHGAVIRGVIRTGHSLSCEPGAWSDVRSVPGEPGGDNVLVGGEAITYSYGFIDRASGAALQRGASTVYPMTVADVGRSIFCEVWAATAGGTGIGRTPPLGPIELPPVEPPPPPPPGVQPQASGGVASAQTRVAAELSAVALAAKRIGVSAGTRSALVKLRCSGAQRCRGTLTLVVYRRSGRTTRRVTIAEATFSVPAGATSTVALRLSGSGRTLLRGSRRALAARLLLRGSTTLPLSTVLDPVELLPAHS
jgi:Trypsin